MMTSMSNYSPDPGKVEPPHQKSSWGWVKWGAVIIAGLIFVVIASCVMVVFEAIRSKANDSIASSNCRQIIIAMKDYAADHQGIYPDGATANEAFRGLIKEQLLEDERVFTVPASPFVPDNDLGGPPDYAKALEKRENHWVMTKGLTDKLDGNTPAVFENPAVKTWPPQWDTRIVERAEPGRVWRGNKIIVGRNDGSVNVEKLKEGEPMATLAPIKNGKNLFELAGPHQILDVEK